MADSGLPTCFLHVAARDRAAAVLLVSAVESEGVLDSAVLTSVSALLDQDEEEMEALSTRDSSDSDVPLSIIGRQ